MHKQKIVKREQMEHQADNLEKKNIQWSKPLFPLKENHFLCLNRKLECHHRN